MGVGKSGERDMKVQVRSFIIGVTQIEVQLATDSERIITVAIPFGPEPITREVLTARLAEEAKKLSEVKRLGQVVIDLHRSKEWLEINDGLATP